MTEKKYRDTSISIGFTNDKVPAFVEKKTSGGLKYVMYGENNDYPNFLLTLFNRSAKHNAISTSKQTYITGGGFTFDQENMQGDDVAKLQAYIKSPNPYESLNDLLNKTDLDELLFGGFYIKGINKKGGGIAHIYHMDYCKVRSDEENKEFYVSDHWFTKDGAVNLNIKENQYKTYPLYDPSKKQTEWIFYYKSYRPGLSTYTLPEYIGAVEAIITDCEIANFHRAEIQNSFKGSKMVVFKNGVPTDEEMKSVERKMKLKFMPTDQAGTFIIDFVDDPTLVPEVIDLSAGDFDKKYEALNKTIQEEIFVGHRIVSPMLFGVRTEGQLGGRNEMLDAFNLYQNTYITPKQSIQERVYDYFAPVKGKLKIQKIEPVMPSFSESILSTILTKDEMRAIIGRKPLDVKANINSSIVDDLNALSPLVANKVLNTLTNNEIRGIVNKPPIEGGDLIPEPTTSTNAFSKCGTNDDKDFKVFQKYGEKAENFLCVKKKKFMYSHQEFALTKLEQGVLDVVKKTPNISIPDLMKVLKEDKTNIENAIETLIALGMIAIGVSGILTTPKGDKSKGPSFEELYIRYRYVLRSDAPPLIGESRSFCQAMIDNPRYFSREDIENIGQELGQIYGIPNYDAFQRRGGWYHDPEKDVNLPFCRHIWQQELVKRVKNGN